MSPTAPITHDFYTCGCLHISSPSSPSPTTPSSIPRPNGTRTHTRLLPTLCPTHHATEPPKTWWAECIDAEELAEAAWRERAKAQAEARESVRGGEPVGKCHKTSAAEKTGEVEVGGDEGDGVDVRTEGGVMDEVGGEKAEKGGVKEEKEGEEGVVWQGRGGSEVVVPVGRRVLQRRKIGRGAKRERC